MTSAWIDGNITQLFDSDYAAWLKSLSRKARGGEPSMTWSDLGPFAQTAYNLHRDLAAELRYQRGYRKDLLPAFPPDYCTAQGFYRRAVETRRKHIGLHNPFVPTPFERLGAFSQWLYEHMARRVREAGYGAAESDWLGDGLDDADDGLGGLDDGLGDDGLGGDDGLALASADDGLDDLGDGL